MFDRQQSKHDKELPNLRKIRRSCNRELYRTAKRLNLYISPQQLREAEQLYYKKVCLNLLFIAENGSNRKLLSDWWEENVCPDIAQIWNVDAARLGKAFREAFGG